MPTFTRIGLDLDGVIIDHTANKLRLAAEHGLTLEPWQTNTNVMGDYVNPDDYLSIRDQAYQAATLEATPVAGALEAIASLQAELFIISARRLASVRYAQSWLDQHRVYDHIPAERIYFCSDESEKRQHCQRLGIQAYLDDKVKVLQQLPLTVRRTLLDSHDLASRLKTHEEIKIVPDWTAFLQLIGH
jgi:beta-phosphoglucomutase-like phosphatase (HAD superfamily)